MVSHTEEQLISVIRSDTRYPVFFCAKILKRRKEQARRPVRNNMGKQIFVADLKQDSMIGEEFEDFFLLKDVKQSKSITNEWANMLIYDRTGEIPGIIYGEDSSSAEQLKGGVVLIRGLVRLYNGENRVSVKTVTPAGEGTSMMDFVPGLTKDQLVGLKGRLDSLVMGVAEPHLNLLLRSVFKKYGQQYLSLPGGYRHHVFAGGLLAHSVETAEMAGLLCDQMGGWYGSDAPDRDVAVTGALLHDIGKVLEFKAFPFGERQENAPYLNYRIRGAVILNELIRSLVHAYPETVGYWQGMLPVISNMAMTCHKRNDEPPRTKEGRLVLNADVSSADMDAYEYEESSYKKDKPDGGFFYSRYFGCNMKAEGEAKEVD